MANAATATQIPFGTPVIHYNQWTGFETKLFAGQFKSLTGEEVAKLSAGDAVYVDVDPLHPDGKVYGRVKGKITGIIDEGRTVFVSYRCDGVVGGGKRVVRSAPYTDFAVAVDENALAKLLEMMPNAKVIDFRIKK